MRAVATERLLRGSGLDDVLMALDAFAAESAAARGGTVCIALLDRGAGSVHYAVRGHPPPLVVEAAGTTRYLVGSTGSPLALVGNRYQVGTDTLRAGDTLVLLLRRRGPAAGQHHRPRTVRTGRSRVRGGAAQRIRRTRDRRGGLRRGGHGSARLR
jgi:hypothetical protein